MKTLHKTTVVIWTEYDPSLHPRFDDDALSTLAREAEVGDAFCSHLWTEPVADPSKDPQWGGADAEEFFEELSREESE